MKICYSCFSELPAGAKVCPDCGCGADLKNEEKYPHALPCGTVLNGRYIVGRVLGQGGFGITYAGQDYNSKILVAIKEYFPDSLASRDSVSRFIVPVNTDKSGDFEYGKGQFLKEAQTLAAFTGCPDIVSVYRFFEENGTAYFVMEYVKGESLRKHVEKAGGRILWEEAWNLLMPVLDALAEVHSRHIIHRDIKPDNVIVTESGRAKLIDFGAARYNSGEKSRSLTAVLTPGYAPVEQYFRRGRQGPWTDVYALAATMYFCITGHAPVDSVERAVRDTLPKPSETGTFIPEYAEEALLKALAVKEEDRFATTNEFRNAVVEGQRYNERQKREKVQDKYSDTEILKGRDKYSDPEILKVSGKEKGKQPEKKNVTEQGKEKEKVKEKTKEKERETEKIPVQPRKNADILQEKAKTEKQIQQRKSEDKNRGKSKDRKGSGKAGILVFLVLLAAGCWFYYYRTKGAGDSGSGVVYQAETDKGSSSGSGEKDSSDGPSDEELEKISFCKDIYQQYSAGFDELVVDYSRDSLETIAQRFQSAGWSFLPTDNWGDLSSASEQIPSMDGILQNSRLLNAVYFLDEKKACRVRIVEYSSTDSEGAASGTKGYRRSIELIGGGDTGGILFSSENGDIDSQREEWLNRAAEKQKKALTGFFPSAVLEAIDQKTFADLGFTTDNTRELRSLTEQYSTTDFLTWDERSWRIYSTLDDGVKAEEATPQDITYFSIEHDSKEITFQRWSEEKLHVIKYTVE